MSTESAPTKQAFQAEVKQILDIVINSLYTDKEIFVRELVSNASDALEKLRHVQLTEREIFDPELELEINITTDEEAKTITIADYGIGMTRDELVENLGTIAHSGSKAFLQALGESEKANANVIGQFGVGFYSAFMVAEEVKVYTHSWHTGAEHLCWTSDGASGYEIEEIPGQHRGSKIVIHLKDDCEEFSKADRIKNILESYSSFVGFPVNLNGERVNQIEALWLKNKSEVTDEQYTEFYKFTAKAFDEPRYRLHFNADAPVALNALIFAPKENPEMFGMGQTDPGVALYCRKVLIDHAPKGLLPEWLRFLKGVIDSEDLPLNISRESMQDSALVKKLGGVITRQFIKFLDKQAKSDPEAYVDFYKKFSRFIKEGAAADDQNRDKVAKLLRFESSMGEAGELVGLEDYLARAKDGQDSIYYQTAPSRHAIETGPYIEAFKERGLEVLFLLDPIDEYVASGLREFDGKKLVAIERADIDLGDAPEKSDDAKSDDETSAKKEAPLPEDAAEALCKWVKETLGETVQEVRIGKRLVSSPAMAVSPEEAMNPQFRQMMKAMNQDMPAPAQVHLELNPKHPMVKKLDAAREAKPEIAKLVASQIRDNALIAAGLFEDDKDMLQRLDQIMEESL